MNYKFDTFGWFSGLSLNPTSRSTELAPLSDSETTTPGELRANFTGHEWKDLPYAAPVVDVPDLAPLRAALIKQIDNETDAIYLAVQGQRGPEYMLAEAEATAYANAGYTGTVPDSVASWATAKTETAQWAADNILATAASWRTAQGQLRLTRLTCKELARTSENLSAVKAQWEGFVSALRQALGAS